MAKKKTFTKKDGKKTSETKIVEHYHDVTALWVENWLIDGLIDLR